MQCIYCITYRTVRSSEDRGGGCSNIVGIICRPGWHRVNWFTKIYGCAPPQLLQTTWHTQAYSPTTTSLNSWHKNNGLKRLQLFQEGYLGKHISSVHERKKLFKCNICDKAFKNFVKIEKYSSVKFVNTAVSKIVTKKTCHQFIHLPFNCEICDKNVCHKSSLNTYNSSLYDKIKRSIVKVVSTDVSNEKKQSINTWNVEMVPM